MPRLLAIPALLCACSLTAGCSVERTPEEFYEDRFPPAPALAEIRAEVDGRLAEVVAALAAGRTEEAVAALDPGPDARYLVSPPSEDGPLAGPDAFRATLARLLADGPGAELAARETGPHGGTAWFAVGLGRAGEGGTLTGVLLRVEGRWQAAQLHLSYSATDGSG